MPVAPSWMRSAARRGLALRKIKGKGGLSTKEAGRQGIGSGVARARDIAGGRDLSRETLGRIAGFFGRHAKNVDRDPGKRPEDDAGYVAGLLWGGKRAGPWARGQIERMARARKKTKG